MMAQKEDWKDTLKKVNITELRNEKEITRAIQYIEAELRTHLQLGTADTEAKVLILESLIKVVNNIGLGQTNNELSRSIDGLLETMTELDQAAADLVAGAEAQAAEFEQELEKFRKTTNPLLPNVSIMEIGKELKRREEMRQQVTEIQEGLENERDTINERLRIIGQIFEHGSHTDVSKAKMEKVNLERKLQGLNKTIEGLVTAVAENDREVELLMAYENAVRLASEGLPEGIIGKNINLG